MMKQPSKVRSDIYFWRVFFKVLFSKLEIMPKNKDCYDRLLIYYVVLVLGNLALVISVSSSPYTYKALSSLGKMR